MKRREFLASSAAAAATVAGCSETESEKGDDPNSSEKDDHYDSLEGYSDQESGIYVEIKKFDTARKQGCLAYLGATAVNKNDEEYSVELEIKLLANNGQERGSFTTSYENMVPGKEYDLEKTEKDDCYPYSLEDSSETEDGTGWEITDIDVEAYLEE